MHMRMQYGYDLLPITRTCTCTHMRKQYDSSYQDNWHSSVLHPNYLEA